MSSIALAAALALALAPASEVATAPAATDMPDPYAAEWEPPPPPAKKVALLDPEPSSIATATPSHPGPAAPRIEQTSNVHVPPEVPVADPRRRQRVLYTGIGFAVAGAVAGSIAYYASSKARKAQERLDTPQIPGQPAINRAATIRELDKQKNIMLGTAIAAAVLGGTGLVLILVATLHKDPAARQRAITRVGPWGLRFKF